MFSKKQYEKIARRANARLSFETKMGKDTSVLRLFLADLAHTFELDNPRFKPKVFLKACGVDVD